MNLPRNVVFNLLSWLLPLVITLKFTPIIIHGLGTESYGIYALVTGFIAYSFYFTVSRATPVYIAEYRVGNKIERIGEVVSATLAINLTIGLFGLLFFLFSTNWLVSEILHISPEFQKEARMAFYLVGVTGVFLMVSQVFNSIPQALHRFDIYASITLATTVLLQTGNVLLVLAGFGLSSLFVWNLALIAINCGVYWLVAKRILPEAKLTLHFPRALLSGIIKYSGGVIAYQILGNFLYIFERSWLTRTSGHEAVAFYVVPMTIAAYIHAFISSLAMVIFPLAAEANAQQNKERLKNIYTRSQKLLTMLMVFPVITLSVCRKEFLTVWLGAEIAQHSATVLMLLAITFGLIAFGVVTWSLADGLGKPWFNALQIVFWIIIALPLMIWLTPKMSVVGLAIGRFFSTALTIPLYTLLIERWIFGRCLWSFWGKTVLLLGIMGAITGIGQHLMILNLPLNWLTIGFTVGVSGLFFCAGLWITPYFEKEEKDWFFRLVKRKQGMIETY